LFGYSYATKQTFKTVSRPLPTTDDGKEWDIAAVLYACKASVAAIDWRHKC